MKHSITEVYKIVGDDSHNYSAEAVKFLNHVARWRDKRPGDCYALRSKTNAAKHFRIYDNLDRTSFHLGFMYGEHTYFDSAEEREEYRAQIAAEKEKMSKMVRVFRSIHSGELVEVPYDFIPTNTNWELVEIKEK